MNPKQMRRAADALERAAAKRMWLQQAEQFAAECGYFQICAKCGESSADRQSGERKAGAK